MTPREMLDEIMGLLLSMSETTWPDCRTCPYADDTEGEE